MSAAALALTSLATAMGLTGGVSHFNPSGSKCQWRGDDEFEVSQRIDQMVMVIVQLD